MKRFIEGEDGKQVMLLPECLDDFVAEDNPVRIIEAFVEELDLELLSFDGAGTYTVFPNCTGVMHITFTAPILRPKNNVRPNAGVQHAGSGKRG
jgi:hypothetical protein